MSNKIFNELKELTDLLKNMDLGSKSQETLNKVKSKIEDLKKSEEFKSADFMTKMALKTVMMGAISIMEKTEKAINDFTNKKNESKKDDLSDKDLNVSSNNNLKEDVNPVSLNRKKIISITGFDIFDLDGRRNILNYLDNVDNLKTNLSEENYVVLSSLFELTKLLNGESDEEKLFLSNVNSLCLKFLNPKSSFEFEQSEIKRFEDIIGEFDSKNIFVSKHFENLVLNLENKSEKELLENSALLNFVKNICEKTNIKNNGDLENFYPSSKLVGKLIEQRINHLYKNKVSSNVGDMENNSLVNGKNKETTPNKVKKVTKKSTSNVKSKEKDKNKKSTSVVKKVAKKTSSAKKSDKVKVGEKSTKSNKDAPKKTKVKM